MHETSASTLAPVIGMLVVSAITPGPNNAIVMEAGARGRGAAAVAITGVASGTLILLVLVWLGVGAVVEASPRLKLALSIVGGAYLVWLGVSLARASGMRAPDSRARKLPASVPAIAVFQLLNPKAWILVITVTAATPAIGLIELTALILAVTGSCLALWAAAGAAASRALERPAARLVFNRVMGSVLALSAVGTVAHALIE